MCEIHFFKLFCKTVSNALRNTWFWLVNYVISKGIHTYGTFALRWKVSTCRFHNAFKFITKIPHDDQQKKFESDLCMKSSSHIVTLLTLDCSCLQKFNNFANVKSALFLMFLICQCKLFCFITSTTRGILHLSYLLQWKLNFLVNFNIKNEQFICSVHVRSH